MEKIVITKANKKDIPRIVEIHRKCVSTTNSKSYPVENIREWLEQINAENVECQLKKSLWFVLKKGKTTIGFCQFNIKDKVLYQMQANPDYQGMGYGKVLYKFIEEYFRKNGVSKISLYATINAVDFYRRLGFTTVKPIKFKLKTLYNDLFEMEKSIYC
ncbi:GNAT family N-acetyltransferase [Patescibacteria group bacterium]|nr:GNAT family N-acetyltransferase [Patescibacteria group bacterium]MBU1952834.1 GNAT family N-acetyltransferase [Patescibacteria group bacterium]